MRRNVSATTAADASVVTISAALSHPTPKKWTTATERGNSGLMAASAFGTNSSPPCPSTVVGSKMLADPACHEQVLVAVRVEQAE